MRRLLVSVAIASMVSALFLVPRPISGQGSSRLAREIVNGREVVAREVLVKFRQAARAADVAALRADGDAEDLRTIGRSGTLHLRSRSLSTAALLANLSRRPDVAYVEPNFIVRAGSEPNDVRFFELWGLRNIGQAINGIPGTPGADIGIVPAWDIALGSTESVVAVIDTGIDYTHPDLAPNMWSAPTAFTVNVGGGPVTCAAGTHGFNAITRSCNPLDDQHHGTHVAGTIGAVGNNGTGVVGVNWTTRLMAIKFIDAQGTGTTADAIASVEFAVAVKQRFAGTTAGNIRVLSNSWGGNDFSQALLDEVNAANDADMLFVAGAGNDSFDNDLLPFYPASFDLPNVVAVTATDNSDSLAWFANIGVESVDLGAPGVDILSTIIGNGYAYLTGTSMATPHVSGAAALVLSRCDMDTATLKETILGTVDPQPGFNALMTSGGRLNVHSALRACIAVPDTPTNLTAHGADSRVTLSWSPALGAMRYAVKRSLTAGGPYTTIDSAVHGTTYIDTGLVNNTPYYYVVSASNTLGESADSDEASATPNIPPDLMVSSFTVPAVGAANSTIVVPVTTKNQGAGIALPSVTRFYWSIDAAIDAGDTPLAAEQSVPQLAPGALNSASVSLTIPAGATGGRYYVIARADDEDVLSESSEANNTAARQIQIGPDLLVLSFSLPSVGAAGGTIAVTETVKNQGGGDAASSTTKFYLSANSTFSADDVPLGGRAVPGLAAGSASTGTTSVVLPAGTSTGGSYIIIVADGGDDVAEAVETNNISARSIQIGPDLLVSSITAPASGGADATMLVTDTTKNQGGAPTGAFTTRFYLSVNSVLDGGDVLLSGQRDVPGLDAGVVSSGSTLVTIPASTPPASYYLIAKADADSQVVETSESNNTFARAVLVGSDLVVSSITVPAKAGAGTTIAVSDTTSNQGGGLASASVTRFYLSTNSSVEAGDTLLPGVHTVPDLGAGVSDTASTSLTIPAAVAPGQYYIIARTDDDNAVIESKESNNILARTIAIGGDLVVSSLTAPATGGAGGSLTLSDTTKNQGGGAVAATSTKFYVSTNTVLDASDPFVGGRLVPPLDAGVVSTVTTTVVMPPNLASGLHYLIVVADADAAAAEVQESNNTLVRAIQIGSDLSVSAITLPVKAAAGASIVVGETTANLGGGDASPSVTAFYFSADSTLGAGDVLLDGTRAVPQLVPGASSVGSTSVTIPAGSAPGTFYIIAKADVNNAVSEASETNNTRVRNISIGPDLSIPSVSLSASSVSAGATVTVSDTVTNQGAGIAGASTTRFYLSTNSVLDAGDVVLAPERAVASIAQGASSTGSTPVVIPASTTPGTYYVIAKADADGVVGESAETNNVTVRSMQVTAAP